MTTSRDVMDGQQTDMVTGQSTSSFAQGAKVAKENFLILKRLTNIYIN